MPESTALPSDVAISFAPVIRQNALRIARRLPSHISVEDLIGAGFMGLVDAYRRYEPSRCDRFDAYAEYRIRGAMLDELRLHDPLSRALRALANRAAAATRKFEVRFGRQPTEAELAEELGLTLEAYRTYAARMVVGPWLSLDGVAPDEYGVELDDPTEPGADMRLLDAQTKQALEQAIKGLPERLRLILELYYVEELTLREIGERLGVTESRVCQLHSDAISRLRAHYAKSDRSEQPKKGVKRTPDLGKKAPQPEAAPVVRRARIAASTSSAWRSSSAMPPALSMM
jgi:RNA polymerase sigma factor for flagellar operon FliA